MNEKPPRRSLTPAQKACLVCAALVALRLVFSPQPTSTIKQRTVQVRVVYDGDTFETDTGERVRLLGINAPEIAHHGRKAEPYGYKATTWLKELIEGESVRIVIDVDEPIDRYGRTLAWVYLLNGELVNKTALTDGHAKLMDRFGLPPELEDELRSAAAEGKQNLRGLWQK